MSLARGLDYYTGVIYEAVVEASAPPAMAANALAADTSTSGTPPPLPPVKSKEKKDKKKKDTQEEEDEVDESKVGVGSIAAGGRYDNLVAMFVQAAAGETKKKAPTTPCVGVSIGLDRIFAILWPKWASRGMRSKATMVYVMAAGDGLLEERIALVQELREAGIKVGLLFSTNGVHGLIFFLGGFLGKKQA
jgi:histidyl-tRNA synthetase